MGDDGEVDLTGTPPSALTTLCAQTGNRRSNVSEALRQLQAEGLCTVRRTGKPPCLRVKFDVAKIIFGDACIVCGSGAKGTGRWCARCKQVLGRDDRSWMIRVLELHGEGYSPPRIAAVLDRPLFVASAVDGRDPHGGAVVPYLLGKGLLGPSWASRLREATRGPVEE